MNFTVGPVQCHFCYLGALKISPATMADHLMEAVAEFSRRNRNTSISLVRVVIYQEQMIPIYVKQMQKAGNPGSSIMDMVTAPFKSFTNAIRGIYFDERHEING